MAAGTLTALGVCGAFATPAPLVIGIEADPSGSSQFARAILSAAYQRIGQAVAFQELPLRRSLAMSSGGEIDGETMRIEGLEAQYPTLLAVRHPLQYAEVRAYAAKAAALNIRSLQDLQNLRVTYIRGVLVLDRALQKHPHIVLAASQTEMARLLGKGIVDVIVTFASAGVAPHDFGDAVVRLPAVLERIPLFHYLHIRNRSLVPKLEAAL
jgi:polar amino acid transport system substrate-binding protein